jgi:hypothetical protein
LLVNIAFAVPIKSFKTNLVKTIKGGATRVISTSNTNNSLRSATTPSLTAETVSRHAYKKGSVWQKDGSMHWYKCAYSGCTIANHGKGLVAASSGFHSFNSSNTCTICSYKVARPVTVSTRTPIPTTAMPVQVSIRIPTPTPITVSIETASNHAYRAGEILLSNDEYHWRMCLYPNCAIENHGYNETRQSHSFNNGCTYFDNDKHLERCICGVYRYEPHYIDVITGFRPSSDLTKHYPTFFCSKCSHDYNGSVMENHHLELYRSEGLDGHVDRCTDCGIYFIDYSIEIFGNNDHYSTSPSFTR